LSASSQVGQFDLRIIFTVVFSPDSIFESSTSNELCVFSVLSLSIIRLTFCSASFSFFTPSAIRHGLGTSLIHKTCTGSPPLATLIGFQDRLTILFTLPYVLCTAITSHILSFHVRIMIDVSIPCCADLRASSTTHTAFLSGL
jgi:hypothetical protein